MQLPFCTSNLKDLFIKARFLVYFSVQNYPIGSMKKLGLLLRRMCLNQN